MTVGLTVWDGAGCIGGNKITLDADGTTLLIDFGLNFKTMGDYFDDFLKPRSVKGIQDYVDFGLIPPIKGLYRPDLDKLTDAQWAQYGATSLPIKIDGFLLSHAHVDHTGSIAFLKKDIPIYCSLETALIAKAMQDIAMSGIGQDVCYIVTRKEDNKGQLAVDKTKPHAQREFTIMDTDAIGDVTMEFWRASADGKELISVPLKTCANRTVQIGNLTIRYWPVDHSIPGAGAFAINTSIGWIVYTGDLRLHGAQGDLSKQFIEEAAALKPVVLISEGTHPQAAQPVTEKEVRDNIIAALAALNNPSAEGRLIIGDFGSRNIERYITFYEIAKQTQRELVVTPKDAYLIKQLSVLNGRLSTKDLRYKVWDNFWKKNKPEPWETVLMNSLTSDSKVNATELQANSGKYILCFSYCDFDELLDSRPQNAIYIYSSSDATDGEMVLDARRREAWLTHLGIEKLSYSVGNNKVNSFHSSGHIHGAGLIEMIHKINPQILVPVHTLYKYKEGNDEDKSDFFKDHFSTLLRLIEPENGKRIVLG